MLWYDWLLLLLGWFCTFCFSIHYFVIHHWFRNFSCYFKLLWFSLFNCVLMFSTKYVAIIFFLLLCLVLNLYYYYTTMFYSQKGVYCFSYANLHILKFFLFFIKNLLLMDLSAVYQGLFCFIFFRISCNFNIVNFLWET